MQWKEFRAHVNYLSERDLKRVEKAFTMCKDVHKEQKRLSGEPYYTHPVAVAGLLADMHADADTIIAALLHDAVEDTPVTLEDIDHSFDGSVRKLIDGVTKLCTEEVASSPVLTESVETLRKMFTLMEQDIRIMVIKLADRLHNMQTVEFLPPVKQKYLAQESLDVYVKIADRLSMQDLRDELKGLCLSVLHPKHFSELQELKMHNDAEGRLLATKIHRALMGLKKPWSGSRVIFEPPSWDRLELQFQFGAAATTGAAPYVVAVIAEDTDECYAILGGLHQLWQREILSFQDFINGPAMSGYRGLHTTVILEDGTRVRCKIRDREMQEYAHRGISMYCFDEKAAGILDYLPWLKNIAPLSEDTRDRSKDFWMSLQNDLLGESIPIHGPSDLTVQLPKGATVLDAAFYLFPDEATQTQSIHMNGKEVPFHTPVVPAAAIDVILARETVVKRQWLDWTNTGLAVAQIHKALGGQSREEKVAMGKELLQEILSSKKHGFIEEFSAESVLKGVKSLGYQTLDDAYIAIADGRTDATNVYSAIFAPQSQGESVVVSEHGVRFSFELGNLEVSSSLIGIFQRYKAFFRKLRVRYNPLTGLATVLVRLNATQPRLASFIEELQAVGAVNVSMLRDKTMIVGSSVTAITVLLLWGVDPVIAHILLRNPLISPVDLTLVRFWTLTAVSGALMVAQARRSSVPMTWLTLRHRSLWYSIFCMIGIALATYYALQGTQPLHYTIPMTSAGLLLTSIVNRRKILRLMIMWGMLLLGCIILIQRTPEWSPRSMLFTLIAVLGFSAFSVVSEQYKRQQVVEARALQYFFLVSAFCSLFTLPLLSVSSLGDLSLKLIVRMAVFSTVFVGAPYYIYYYLLSHKQIDFVLRFSFLIILTTGFGQFFAEHWLTITPATILAGLIVMIGAVIPMLPEGKKGV